MEEGDVKLENPYIEVIKLFVLQITKTLLTSLTLMLIG